MNLDCSNWIKARVTKILSKPRRIKHCNLRRVIVEYKCGCWTRETVLYFETLEEALDLKVGYEFYIENLNTNKIMIDKKVKS